MIAQLLRKRTLQTIWLEPSKSLENHECICIWREKEKGLDTLHHFEMDYYTCRCSLCSSVNEVDEVEDLLHLVDFFATVVIQPCKNPFYANASSLILEPLRRSHRNI